MCSVHTLYKPSVFGKATSHGGGGFLRLLQLFGPTNSTGIKSILIKDKSKYRKKNRRVKFKLEHTFKSVKKMAMKEAADLGIIKTILAKLTTPRVIENWLMVRMALR